MNKKTPHLVVKDHSVSGEKFELCYNESLDMLETYPQPSLQNLPSYYESEDYISHTDAKRNLFESVYHLVRSYSLKQKLKLINKQSVSGKTLLDVGCGTGDFLQTALKNNWNVFGVEPNPQARNIANKKNNNVVYDADKISEFKKESFDVITLWHVLEHLPNLEEQLALYKSLLKKEGTLIVAVPNFKSFDATYYKEFWAAYDVPRHLWHFSRTAISKLVSKNNMKVVKTLPMMFDAYYVSLLSEGYKSGSKNPLKAFYIGFRSNLKAKQSKEYSSHIYIIKNT
ncbi:class I SAM-dependent methyltransferase [Corallibacter sp.]|uniref:class I SAM-dependent methyltransferase n=1 Tax=Corallibacter sp. TaxID=2038084 RepID=UPI003AB509C3